MNKLGLLTEHPGNLQYARAEYDLGSSPGWKLSRWSICLTFTQMGHIRHSYACKTHLSEGSRKATSIASYQKPKSACGHWPCQALNTAEFLSERRRQTEH